MRDPAQVLGSVRAVGGPILHLGQGPQFCPYVHPAQLTLACTEEGAVRDGGSMVWRESPVSTGNASSTAWSFAFLT